MGCQQPKTSLAELNASTMLNNDRAKVLKSDGDSVKEPLSTQITPPPQDTDVDSQKSQTQKNGPPKEPGGAGNHKRGAESSGDHGEQHSYDDAAARRQVSASVLGMFGFAQQ